jgi:biopolymer transport protein ExbD
MMRWSRGRYAHGRYTWGNYVAQKDHSRLGNLWRLSYNGKEVAQSMTLRGAKEAAYEHFNKALAALRENGL